MPQTNANRFHPKRWTPLTWLAILLWAWEALPHNYPPSVSYKVDSVTGKLSDPTHYKSLSEIPFPVGWPIHYVTPSYLFTPLQPLLAGSPVPPPAPSKVSLFAMAANFVLIVIAISALVYLLQKYLYQYSLLFVLLLMLIVPFYFTMGRLVVLLAGYNAGKWYHIAVYFSPIAVALAARYSVCPRFKLARFRLNCKDDRNSCDDYDNPEDAIAAALRLDMRGEWTPSIILYRDAAKRWPEHGAYINRCIDQIVQKQHLAQM
jgi:hypothetical protein